MTKGNLVRVLVSALCSPAAPSSCGRVLCGAAGGCSLHRACAWLCGKTPHPIQLPAEGGKGYGSATLPLEASEEDAN